jgi:tetratricopeptide (TPR) repeat protein
VSRERFRAIAGVVLCLSSLSSCIRTPQHYVDRGNKLFAAGKLADAELQYRKAIQKEPDLGAAWLHLGLTQLRRGSSGDAFLSLSRAVELLPASEEAKVQLGDLSLTLYVATPARPKILYDRISALSDALLTHNPRSFDGVRLKGSLALVESKPDIAVECFRKANELSPNQSAILMGLSEALFQRDEFEEAEKIALQLLRKDPNFWQIYDVLYSAYTRKNRSQQARQLLELKVARNPKSAQFALQLAGHYAREHKTNEMASCLQRLLDNPADFPNSALEVGDFYLSLGSLDEALRYYQRGAQGDANQRATYRKRIARLLIAQNKTAEAAKLVDSILTDNPKDQDSQAIRADLWLKSGDRNKVAASIASFEALVKAKPEDPNLHFDLGRAYALKGDLNKARAEMQESLKLKPQFVSGWLELAQLDLRLTKYNKAIEGLDRVISREPDNLKARLLRADGLRASGRYSESRKEILYILQRRPQDRDALLALGSLGIAEHKFNDAEKTFDRLRESEPKDVRALAGLAEVYSSRLQFDRSMALLSKQLQQSPNVSEIHYLLATTAIRAGRYDVAIDQLQRVLSSDSDNLAAQLRLGDVYRLNGEPDKAISAYKRAEQMAPNDLQPTFSLALTLDSAGRFDEAKARYARVISVEPKNAWALNKLALLLAENGGNLDEALGLAQRAAREPGFDPNISDTVGWIYLKKKMYDSAAQVFNQLVAKYPNNPAFRYHLGALLLEKGDREHARKELNLALTKGPNPHDEAKIKRLLTRIG